MPAKKYRTIKNPPGYSHLTLKEAMESARIVAEMAAKGHVVTAKTKGRLNNKIASSKAVSKDRNQHRSPVTRLLLENDDLSTSINGGVFQLRLPQRPI
jgi:hypothetical protein